MADDHLTLPSSVSVYVSHYMAGGTVALRITGPVEDVIRAGLATREMCQPIAPGDRWRRKIDPEGRPYGRELYFRSAGGTLVPAVRFRLQVPLDAVAKVPGGAEALALDRRRQLRELIHELDEDEARDLLREALRMRERRSAPRLRLVVDNTRA